MSMEARASGDGQTGSMGEGWSVGQTTGEASWKLYCYRTETKGNRIEDSWTFTRKRDNRK